MTSNQEKSRYIILVGINLNGKVGNGEINSERCVGRYANKWRIIDLCCQMSCMGQISRHPDKYQDIHISRTQKSNVLLT